MKFVVKLVSCAILVGSVPACAAPAAQTSTQTPARAAAAPPIGVLADARTQREIRDFYHKLDQFNRAGDADGLLDWYYWPEAVHGGQGIPIYMSKEAFREGLKVMMHDEGLDCRLDLDTVPIVASGNLAVVYYQFECAHSAARKASGEPPFVNRVVDVLEKRHGQWKLIRQNTSNGTWTKPE